MRVSNVVGQTFLSAGWVKLMGRQECLPHFPLFRVML